MNMETFAILFSLIWGGLFALLGTVFLAVSLFMKKRTDQKEERCNAQVSGKVMDIIASYDNLGNNNGRNRSKVYYPVVSYSVEGKTLTQRASVGTNPCHYVIEQSVEVRYNPDNPSEIILQGDGAFKKITTIFKVVAYILFALGIIGVCGTIGVLIFI